MLRKWFQLSSQVKTNLVTLHPKITNIYLFIPCDEALKFGGYARKLENIGIKYIYSDSEDFNCECTIEIGDFSFGFNGQMEISYGI